MKINNILEDVGDTPVVRLSNMFPNANVWMKLEKCNPGGSIKDRIAIAMIEDAEKRNLITNSAEYYNLSYEYLNDCLRAGLVYRREFYNDSELEPEDSLMFKVTLTPFGDISSPSFR